MQKVQITVFGRVALVDEDMVKKMLKKEALVNECSALREIIELDPSRKVELFAAQTFLAKKIIRLNRTIRRNVQFL
jgi:hypothetical protein